MVVIIIKRIFLSLLFLILLSSCTKISKTPVGNSGNNDNRDNAKKPRISDYYPYKANQRMKYAGTGNEYAEKDVYVDIIKGDRIQLRIINPGTTLGQVLENRDGELRVITSLGELYLLQDLTGAVNDSPEILLKEPLEKGTKWILQDGRTRYISGMEVKISTPSGEYSALEVTTRGEDYEMLDYYVLNIGHVKSVFKSGEMVVDTSLEKTEDNAKVQQTIKFYYPEFLNNRLVYISSREAFETNNSIADTFDRFFKASPVESLTPLMSQNTKINNLYVDLEKSRVYVDFSKEFVTEMNAGASLESMILKSVTNTLGNYYNVDKVYISIDGAPYSSGHVQIGEKDNFFVDYEGVEEYKK